MALVVKNQTANAGDTRDRFGLQVGRSVEEELDNPLCYSCLENPKDREAWCATVHGVAKNQTLKPLSVHAQIDQVPHPRSIDETVRDLELLKTGELGRPDKYDFINF